MALFNKLGQTKFQEYSTVNKKAFTSPVFNILLVSLIIPVIGLLIFFSPKITLLICTVSISYPLH